MKPVSNRAAGLRRLVSLGMTYAASSGSLAAASAAQLATFAILARALGPAEFGAFVKITALTSIAVYICGLGASDCLLRRVSQDRAVYPLMLGHNILLIGATGLVLVLAGLAVMPYWLVVAPEPGANLLATGLLLVTNIVLVRVILLAELIFLGHSRYRDANRAVIVYALARTATAGLACLVFGTTTLAQWAVWQFAGNAAVVLAYVWWLSGLGRPRFGLVREEIRLGLLFCSQFVGRALRQNADLFALGLVAPIEMIGSYGVARRVLDSSSLTIDALNRLLYPRFARASLAGLHAALPSVRAALPAALLLGAATSVALFLLAPFLPLLFGRDYVSLAGLVRGLSGLPLLVACWAVALDALGASSHQGARAAIVNTANLLGSGLVIGATWLSAPAGTIAALYLIEAGTVVAAWWTLLALARRSEARVGTVAVAR